MIVEFNDIVDGKRGFGHVQPLPKGVPLGRIFERGLGGDAPDISGLLPSILQVSVNGCRLDNWQTYCPSSSDRIIFVIGPQFGVGEGIAAIASIISAVVSVVQLIISLVASPSAPKRGGAQGESGAYSFEGIRSTYQLGSPVAVTYGEGRKGGQVLMYYLTMMPQNKGTRMHMLVSLGEGPVAAINAVELNNQPVTDMESVSVILRLGTSSQAIIPEFATTKNTFHDGRYITDRQKNFSIPACSSIVYRTTAYDADAIEFIVTAPFGMFASSGKGKHPDRIGGNYVDYSIEYRRQEVSDSHSGGSSNAGYSFWELRRFAGQTRVQAWDFGSVRFPRPGQYDVRFTFRRAQFQQYTNQGFEIALSDITEIRGPSGPFSSEALVAINAAPTAQLNGGQPNVTALVSGLLVKNYTSVNSYVVGQTSNPAWNMVDWMTNSRYGMGADITEDEIDIQSFLDFATLAESLAEICDATSGEGCPRYGTPDFFSGNLYIDSKTPIGISWFNNDQIVTLRSKYNNAAQSGIVTCVPCCPPDYYFGVNSADYLNSWIEVDAEIGEVKGSPIFGLTSYVLSGSNANSATMYGVIVNSNNIALCRWNGTSPTTYGTVLQSMSTNLISSSSELYLAIDQNYEHYSVDSSAISNTLIYWAYFNGGIWLVDTEYLDSSASRITYLNRFKGAGAVVFPNSAPGVGHDATMEFRSAETGLCYSGIGNMGSFELDCVQNIPFYDVGFPG